MQNAIASFSRLAAHIQNQLKEDEMSNQLTMEDIDPFTGSKEQSPRACQTVFAPSGAASKQGICPKMKKGLFILRQSLFSSKSPDFLDFPSFASPLFVNKVTIIILRAHFYSLCIKVTFKKRQNCAKRAVLPRTAQSKHFGFLMKVDNFSCFIVYCIRQFVLTNARKNPGEAKTIS